MFSRQTYSVLNVIGLRIIGPVSGNINWNQTGDIVTCSLKIVEQHSFTCADYEEQQIHKCKI